MVGDFDLLKWFCSDDKLLIWSNFLNIFITAFIFMKSFVKRAESKMGPFLKFSVK